jgi:hypothetical protein
MRTVVVVVVALTLFAGSAAAHHSFSAQYDRSKSHTITGPVTKMEWQNPHIYFYVAVKDDSGRETVWAVEGMAPNGLYRQGWRRDSVQAGDVVTVEGWLARDGSNLLNMGIVMLNGKRIFSGTAPTN